MKGSESQKWSVNFIDGYFEYILSLYKKEELSPKCYMDLLIIISDAIDYLKDPVWEEVGYSICKKIKEEIERDGINPYRIGMFGSLGRQAFAVDLYNKNTGNLKKFSLSLNDLLIKIASKRAQMLLEEKPSTYASHYDCIGGISGILSYLVDTEIGKKQEELLFPLVRYLTSLTDKYQYKKEQVLRFHIPKANLYTDFERKLYPTGHLNFSLSHGMLGPLIALGKAKRNGIELKGMNEAINTIQELYNRYETMQNQKVVWPCYISPREYYYNLKPKYASLLKIQRSSWCYGNVSVARGLQLVARYCNDYLNEQKYKSYLTDIIDAPTTSYHLDNPGLCHGYASMLAIGSYFYSENKSNRLNAPIDRCVLESKNIFYENGLKSTSEIIDQYFEADVSLLQGAGGFVAGLLEFILHDRDFGRLLMIK